MVSFSDRLSQCCNCLSLSYRVDQKPYYHKGLKSVLGVSFRSHHCPCMLHFPSALTSSLRYADATPCFFTFDFYKQMFVAGIASVGFLMAAFIWLNRRNERRRVANGKPAKIHDRSMDKSYNNAATSTEEEAGASHVVLSSNADLGLTDLKNDEFGTYSALVHCLLRINCSIFFGRTELTNRSWLMVSLLQLIFNHSLRPLDVLTASYLCVLTILLHSAYRSYVFLRPLSFLSLLRLPLSFSRLVFSLGPVSPSSCFCFLSSCSCTLLIPPLPSRVSSVQHCLFLDALQFFLPYLHPALALLYLRFYPHELYGFPIPSRALFFRYRQQTRTSTVADL